MITNKDYVFFNEEEKQEQIDFQKILKEREEPLRNISAFYQEQRKLEAEARAKAEAEELASLPPKPLSTDDHIQLLTKAVAELTLKLNEVKGKGE